MQLPNNSTIQKPYYKQSVDNFTMAGVAEAMRPDKFTSVHFKRWLIKVGLWFRAMHVWDARLGKPEGELTAKEQKKFTDANDLFIGCIFSVLENKVYDAYMHHTDAKELWDALIAEYDASNAGSELYLMETFHNYRMVNNRNVVEQAHEVVSIMRELELLNCPLPDKFVAGCVIAKFPSSWKDFTMTLKHKRQELSVQNLIASFDVEDKAWAKDAA